MKVDRAMTKKRPGAALLAIVLIGFLVLSLISSVVVTIARNTSVWGLANRTDRKNEARLSCKDYGPGSDRTVDSGP